MQDIWEFKDYQYPDYPTEKNIDLLKTIIAASSNEASLVMDFFCGSGTTLIGRRGPYPVEPPVRTCSGKIAATRTVLNHLCIWVWTTPV
jgi:hypothetical protein